MANKQVVDPRFLNRLLGLYRNWDRWRGGPPDQDRVDRMARVWEWAADPAEEERLSLCSPAGEANDAWSPRWLAHLLGFPHRTVHVGLTTPSGLVLLQRRSQQKEQFPGAWDMSVTGHVSLPADATLRPVDFLEAALREIEEELGLPAAEQDSLFEPPGLQALGPPAVSIASGETGGRPWCDVEVRQLFAATLTPAGLARLAYSEAEISGLLLCRFPDALSLLDGPEGAAGAFESLQELAARGRAG